MIVNFMRLRGAQAQGSIGRSSRPSRMFASDPPIDQSAYFAGAGGGLAAPGDGVGPSLICGAWLVPGRLVVSIRCTLVISRGTTLVMELTTRLVMGVIRTGGVAD